MAEQTWTWAAQVDIKAAASDAGDGAAPAFESVVYTGGKLVLGNFPAPVVIDLAGATFRHNIIANHHHDKTRPIGSVSEVTNDGRMVRMSGVLNHAGGDREEILASVKQGFKYEASIEARPTQLETVAAGERAFVNGQNIDGPAIIARRSEVYGVAFVPQGADEKTSVRIAASAAHSLGGQQMTFEQWAESLKIDIKACSAEQLDEIKAAHAHIYPSKPSPSRKAKTEEAVEDWSAEDIRAAYDDQSDAVEALEVELCDEYDTATIKASIATCRKAIRDTKAKAVRGKWSRERFELEAERHINAARIEILQKSRPVGPAIHSSAKDLSGEVIEAALCQTLKIKDADKLFDPKVSQSAHSTFRGRLGLQQLLIMAAANNGWNAMPGVRLADGNLRECLGYAFNDPRYARHIHAGNFTNVGLTGILSNVANKEILQGYMEVDQTWREIAMIRPVNDFKQVTAYRLLDSLEYELLPADGRIKLGTISEESYTRQANTYAKMLAITRKDIINDDLGAFDDLRMRLGRGAAKKFNTVFWTAFLDNSSFFTSGNTNYISGSTTNLGADGVGLGLGVKAFRKMTSPTADGTKRVGNGMRPTKVLVPPELEQIARALYVSANGAMVKASDANTFAGLYRPIVANQLSDSAFTGYSTTAWYLFGDELAPMAVSFLNGQESPTVESSDADFDQLGIQFRGYHDFGCDKAEYLSGVKSKGAA